MALELRARGRGVLCEAHARERRGICVGQWTDESEMRAISPNCVLWTRKVFYKSGQNVCSSRNLFVPRTARQQKEGQKGVLLASISEDRLYVHDGPALLQARP